MAAAANKLILYIKVFFTIHWVHFSWKDIYLGMFYIVHKEQLMGRRLIHAPRLAQPINEIVAVSYKESLLVTSSLVLILKALRPRCFLVILTDRS